MGLREDAAQFGFPCLRRAVRLFALATDEGGGIHRHPGAIDLDIEDGDRIGTQVLGAPNLGALRRDEGCGEIDQPLDLPAIELHVGHGGQV